MLVAADGSLLTIQEGTVFLTRPHDRRTTRVTTGSALAQDLALRGGTVYWTEAGQTTPPVARSTTLDGVSGSDEPHVLTPTTVRRARTPCERAKGRTVAASARVRVYVPRGAERRIACRYARKFRRVAAGDTGAPAPRVVNDRWVLLLDQAQTAVLDTIDRRRVTRITTPISELTLLNNGTLAWIDDAARVLAQHPDDDGPTELGPGAAGLASSRTTLYWTAGGQPQRATP